MLSWVEHEKSYITPGPGQRNSHDLSGCRQQKSGAQLLQQIEKGVIIHLVYRGGIKKGSKVINHNWANNHACIHDVTNSRFKLFWKFTHLLLPIPIPPIQSRRPIYMYTLLNWYLRARTCKSATIFRKFSTFGAYPSRTHAYIILTPLNPTFI